MKNSMKHRVWRRHERLTVDSRDAFSTAIGGHFRSGAVVFLLAVAFFPTVSAAQVQVRSLPNDAHYGAFRPYMQGDFLDARRAFMATPRRASTEGVWVDSIAYHTMIGECTYQMGDLKGALQQYTTALQIYLQYPNWLLRVSLPATLKPSNRAGRRVPPWGTSSRTVRVASIPDRVRVGMGNSDAKNQQVLQQGGVFRSPYTMLVDVREIVRCTALAIRRRGEILGPAGQYDSLNSDLIAQLSRRPAPAGSWAQAWISVELGLAYASKGRTVEAVTELKNSLLAAGMDHNLTSTALLELGKLAFQAKDYSTAGNYFFEAAYSAAMMLDEGRGQSEIVAEAFRWGAIAHMLNFRGTFSKTVGAAAEWARRGDRIVEASLLLSAAENCVAINDANHARTYLDRAAQVMRRRECTRGELGARFQFVTAQASYLSGDSKRGTPALANALAFQRKASRRMFQIWFSDHLFTSGNVTTRQAGLLYTEVLRDSTAHDWALDPLESLAVLTIPHMPAFEHWFLLSLERKENDNALRISEAMRRHRFYSSLPLGGRILNLRWSLEAPTELLPQAVVLQRQDLLNRHGAFAERSRIVNKLCAELAALPVASDDPATQKKLIDLQKQIEKVSAAMERTLEAMALSREPGDPVFPPNTDVTLVQQQLTPEQQVLVFVSTRGATHVFMLGPEKYSTWKLKSPMKIKAGVAKMLREMGQYDRNQPLGLKELSSDAWKATAADVLQQLTANAPADAWDEFKELIIVPDGMLWYVPFEALQIQNGDQYISVIDKVRVRYAPTIALAVPDKRPRSRVARTAVVTGALFPGNGDELARELLDDLKNDDPNVYGVSVKPPPATVMVAKSVGRLVVLNDLDNDVKGPYDWAPMPVARGKGAGSLAQWMKLPWGGPDEVLLPGFHTPAENGLKRGGTGDEMFLTVCGLLSTGTRTILISRWRDGGRTTFDLIREFVRELPHRSASQAWQRSVRLAVSGDLAWRQEPRVKEVPPDTPSIKAQHPFFWSGYMLIDSGVVPK